MTSPWKILAISKSCGNHHVGGYLKIAPEHTEEGPLSKMMKPGMGSYDRFKELFDTYSKQAGKEQYLIPYFISAHPGTRDEDMVNLALWLKAPLPPRPGAELLSVAAGELNHHVSSPGKTRWRRLVIRAKTSSYRRATNSVVCIKRCWFRNPANWPLIRQALEAMGKKHLIGSRRDCLVPAPTIEEMREARPARTAIPVRR